MVEKKNDDSLMSHIKELSKSVEKLKRKRTPKFFQGKKKAKKLK